MSIRPSVAQFLNVLFYRSGHPALVFLVSCGGVRLSPLGNWATIWPIVPDPDDRWWVWSSRWNENWQEHGVFIPRLGDGIILNVTFAQYDATV
jgi:hypothetical protein